MWLAVRTLYHFGTKTDGTHIFEERIVCFSAETADNALQKAELASEQYANDNHFEAHPDLVAYEQDGDALIDGYELWSQLMESRLSLRDFYEIRYAAFDYIPEC